MKFLRTKGSTLPILIKISIKYPNVDYILENKKSDFKNIQNFLYNAKNNIEKRIDIIYKEKTNLRFVYGKQFEIIIKHFTRIFLSNRINNNIIRFFFRKII